MSTGYSISLHDFTRFWNERDSYPEDIRSRLVLLVEKFAGQNEVAELHESGLKIVHEAIQASTSQQTLYNMVMTMWR